LGSQPSKPSNSVTCTRGCQTITPRMCDWPARVDRHLRQSGHARARLAGCMCSTASTATRASRQ
jgi:hypothetical protein